MTGIRLVNKSNYTVLCMTLVINIMPIHLPTVATSYNQVAVKKNCKQNVLGKD